jgi:hypothetical protein
MDKPRPVASGWRSSWPGLGGRYLDWKGADLTRALTARGVRKKQVWVEGQKNLQGFWP